MPIRSCYCVDDPEQDGCIMVLEIKFTNLVSVVNYIGGGRLVLSDYSNDTSELRIYVFSGSGDMEQGMVSG